MHIYYEIEARLLDENGTLLPGAMDFQKRYQQFRPVPGNFVFSDKGAARDALSELEALRLVGKRLYRIEVDESEIESHPAFYLGIEVVMDLLSEKHLNLKYLTSADIAVDYASDTIVASNRVRHLLTMLGAKVDFRQIASTRLGDRFAMTVTTRLPDPLDMPMPVEIGSYEDEPELSSLRSDGRDIISAGNIAVVGDAGIAISDMFRSSGHDLRYKERIIASGTVMSALRGASVSGLLTPIVPLITEEQYRALDDLER